MASASQYTGGKAMSPRCCVECGSTETYISKTTGVQYWRKGRCQKCHDKQARPKRLSFKEKRIYLSANPRKGVCTWCGKKKGESYITHYGKTAIVRTLLHHKQYHPEDPLRDTVELCWGCHVKAHTNCHQ
jgi:hypothetical protein